MRVGALYSRDRRYLSHEQYKVFVEDIIDKIGQNNHLDINYYTTDGVTIFHTAVMHRDVDFLRSLLKKNPARGVKSIKFGDNSSAKIIGYNTADKYGNTPLHIAALAEDKELISLLIDSGADPNLLNNKGENSLIFAIRAKKLENVKFLISKGARISNFFGRSALDEAVKYGAHEIVSFFLEKGINPNRQNISDILLGRSVIFAAAKVGNLEIVKMLLNAGARTTSFFGRSALYYAARYGHSEIVELLLQKGSNPNGKNLYDLIFGGSVLYAAVRSGNKKTVSLLLNAGARTTGFFARSLIYEAASCGHTEILQLLLEKGFDPKKINVYDNFIGILPLCVAASNGHVEIVRLLLEHGANPNNRGILYPLFGDESPLHNAVERGNLEVVRLLLADQRTNPNLKINSTGEAIIHSLVHTNKYHILTEVLKDNRVDLNIQNRKGQTALHKAVIMNNIPQVKLLLADSRVNPNVQANDGMTPLCEAIKMGNKQLVAILLQDSRINLLIPKSSNLPLILAINNSNNAPTRDEQIQAIEIIKLLLNAGADRNQLVPYSYGVLKKPINIVDPYNNALSSVLRGDKKRQAVSFLDSDSLSRSSSQTLTSPNIYTPTQPESDSEKTQILSQNLVNHRNKYTKS